MNLEAEFSAFVNKYFPLNQNDKVLLAVSGGPDSMALLHLMLTLTRSISVAHCNFSLRKSDSDADEQLVVNTCKELNIDCYTKRFDTIAYSQQHSLSIQLAARQLRYNWFDELCSEHGFTYIATAHHYDDQVETILMNLIRGTGIKGLSGIPLQNGRIIRPLLFATKTRLIEYLNIHSHPFRIDASNHENKYLRNALRNEIIPALNALNPQAANHIYELGTHAKFASQLLRQKIDAFRSEYCFTENKIFNIHYSEISLNENATILLFELLCEFGFNAAQCQQIHAAFMAAHTGSRFYTDSYELTINRNIILVEPLNQTKIPSQTIRIPLMPHQQYLLGYTPYVFELIDSSSIQSYASEHLYLDADVLTFPIIARVWKQGDTFIPLGSKGRKKISDFLIDRKIALSHKRNVYVLESASEIAGIFNLQVSHTFRITSSTKKVLHIYKKDGNNNEDED